MNKKRNQAFSKYLGEKVLVWNIPTAQLHTGILIGTTLYTIRYKTTNGEVRVKKDDVFLINHNSYKDLVNIVNRYNVVKTELEGLVNSNVIL